MRATGAFVRYFVKYAAARAGSRTNLNRAKPYDHLLRRSRYPTSGGTITSA